MRRILVALAGVVLGIPAGCTSGGELGQNGLVRFSQVLHFVETEDFGAPIAVGATMLIALQRPAGAVGIDAETYADLELRVQGVGGEDDPVIQPLGFAQYAVTFTEAGSYQLVADRQGEPLDALDVEAEEAVGIRLAGEMDLSTMASSGEGSCSRTETLTSLVGLILYANQSLDLYVVPTTADGAPMLGLLALVLAPPDGLEYDAPLVGHGALANALTIRGGSFLPDPMSLQVLDRVSGLILTLTVPTRSQDLMIDCD